MWYCRSCGRLERSRLSVFQVSGFEFQATKWTEFASTLMVLTAVVLAFRYAVIYLDILPKSGTRKWMVNGSAA